MARPASAPSELTPRQREVAALLARGYSNAEIAERLGISLDGAKWHVSELIGKFGVDSRDEVADAWEAHRRSRRWAWLGAIAGLAPLKVAAVAAGVLAVGAGAATIVAVAAQAGGGDDTPAEQAATPVPSATPTATPTIALPAPPGTVFTAQEALGIALAALEAYLRELDGDVVTPVQVSDLQLESATWNPGITVYTAPSDPDRFWDARDGVPRYVWAFRWVAPDVTGTNPGFGTGYVQAEVLVEDGDTGEPLAILAWLTQATGEGRIGRAGGWRSQYRDELQKRMRTASGPALKAAWLNGDDQSASLELFPNLDGNWCIVTTNASGERLSGPGSCLVPGTAPWQPLQVPLGFEYNPATGIFSDVLLEITCSVETVRIEVTRSDGEVLSFPVTAPIEPIPVEARFAYINIGPMPQQFTVRSFDAAGSQIAETTLGLDNFNVSGPPTRPGP